MTEELYVLPASFGQKRLWLLEQIQPDTPLYTMAAALRLRGTLDVTALSAALTEVVQRHEVLRTVLRLDGGQVVQVVREPGPVDLETVEAPDGFDAAVLAASRLAARPFDLATGPLLRCYLVRAAADDHLLLAVVHHTVADGWSMGVLMRELTALYAAGTRGVPAALPELPVQYADYALWQQEQLDSGALTDQLDFWRRELAGVTPLRLPPDHPRTPAPTFAAATAPVTVAAAAVRQLRAVAEGDGVTASMVAMAAYAAVLARWSRQDDLVIGVPVAGRAELDLEPLVGFFVNTLPIRLDLSDDPTFGELLGRVRDHCLAAYQHADIPFELLVDELKPDRRAGQLPLAQTMLAVNNTVLPHLTDLPGLTVEPVRLPETRAHFDVTLDLVESDDALRGIVAAQADLFTAETAALVARSFTTLLRAAVVSPSTRLSELPCPVATERDVDVVALPSPDTEPAPVGGAIPDGDDTARTPTELVLVRLWSEILERDGVGVHEEFYAAGGNSLRAVRVVLRARELGVDLPVDAVLGEHTIRDLAALA
ncbi:condensation domain-containing protein [Actinoplanes sp. NEAU-A12]|uniref:Condensation domain-containing protein n=1 Tax=Actinoplanes sandaracinus TaxID=3045177 RepID=A0ABT6WTF5_9ACTN|nr:condensation domain-containing protein [Actinoplanes sandaracinus]MDI6103005.1 condensation domain-containing protein [Actinoplanes sandaracinus]